MGRRPTTVAQCRPPEAVPTALIPRLMRGGSPRFHSPRGYAGPMQTTRRHFIRITFAVGAGALGLGACGEESPSGNGDAGTSVPLTVSIGSNHGHSTTVTMADLMAATERTYDIEGAADHAHSVTVSAADFATLSNEGSVTLQSTLGDGHSHSVTISV